MEPSGQRGRASSEHEPTANAKLQIRIIPLVEICGSVKVPSRDSKNFIYVLVFGSVIITPPATIWISIGVGLPVWAPVVIVALQLLAAILATRETHPTVDTSDVTETRGLPHNRAVSRRPGLLRHRSRRFPTKSSPISATNSSKSAEHRN
jgi:hypothetical protein